ncbi:D-isomer specific 2-hydroxyacid dehydrogenase,catalytic domain [Moorella glycerini]|uniref:D-3-phosphoglycerate dehydrogenase n=1 Tax=Neomoorella stamsii TaxID=1266720 RepID=A0A9X7J606_9FIRM|nr:MULTISPECIES: hydroxyacid dehydrogenase [Moorella]PRR76351.1 D-3-phosphoglycerate dehydrogenase [Moorella stamsii]CEP67080.1 D-isomer specific 2-hydroxyacid dehydrogenase,catalytic domain [Moorella glycerini]
MKKKVLIVQPIHESGLKVFDDRFEVRVAPDPSVETVKREIKGVEGVVVRTAPFTREIIAAADSLKVIARHGVGVDNIDLRAATERGILVLNTPDANAVSVAEHTLTAIGALAKRVLPMDRATRRGDWEVRNEYKAVDLDGKVLGLIGIGRIGTLVARKAAAAFNMQVIAYDPYVRPEVAAKNGVILYEDLDRIFREADVISIHTPLTAETRGLVNGARLAMMKPSAFLVNFSRGGVVDEEALYQALKRGAIAGAALDVFEEEPPSRNHPLFELDNVLLSPHSAALTQECVVRMATGAARGVVEVLTGREPQFVVNTEVLKQ